GGPEAGRLRAHGGGRHPARPVLEELLGAAPDPGADGDRLHGGPASADVPDQERASDHGASAEHVVPSLRPEPADVYPAHCRGQGVGLRSADAPGVPFAGGGVAPLGGDPAVMSLAALVERITWEEHW